MLECVLFDLFLFITGYSDDIEPLKLTNNQSILLFLYILSLQISPYSIGRYSMSALKGEVADITQLVLILILLEDTL